jgi:hypothetical protein
MFSNQKNPKKPIDFICENCNFVSSNRKDYNKHILTKKHIVNVKQSSDDHSFNKNPIFTQEHISSKNHVCDCGRIYSDNSGLWRHKKKCNKQFSENDSDNNNKNLTDKDLIMMLINENKDFKQIILDQNKTILELSKNNTNITNNTNNSHNKTFNMQIFLNEECKDALNISEFVSSIKVQLEDLETTGRLGYVEGVSRIINKNLNELDQNKRPIHCSDVKREVLYIKNDDQWVKENETNKPILTKAIKQIASENIKQISEWRKKYPDCTDSESRKNDLYLNIVSNAMSGCTAEEQVANYEKIITKVAKEVTIEK